MKSYEDLKMDNDYLNSVAMSGLFKYLRDEHYGQAWKELNMTPKFYHSNRVIYGQDDPVTMAAIVHSGLVKGERLQPEGTASLAYFYERGDIFAFEGAFSGKRTSPLNIIAHEDAIVVFFNVRNIFTSAFQQELATGLMELLANDDIKKLYRIETLSKKGLRDRIMSYLKILAAKNGSNVFEVDMSREQMAEYLCVNRSALSYELNQMKREGIIDFNKKVFKITTN